VPYPRQGNNGANYPRGRDQKGKRTKKLIEGAKLAETTTLTNRKKAFDVDQSGSIEITL